jgi:Leucine-rich repeat (LRR) protein
MLIGEIPSSFAELKNLTLLSLLRNRLQSVIPELIGDLPEIEVLELSANNFTGSIPQGLGKNGKLQLLDLTLNKLIGTLPPNLCIGNPPIFHSNFTGEPPKLKSHLKLI